MIRGSTITNKPAANSGAVRAGALAICALLMIGFYLRSESLWGTVVVAPEIRSDARDYFLYAYNLRHHGVYSRDDRGAGPEWRLIRPDALRSPGYPLFLAPFIGGTPVEIFLARVKLAQVILGSLAVVIAYLMCRRFLNWPFAFAAAALTALSPHLVVINTYLLTETLFCFALVAAGWWVGRAAVPPGWRPAAVLGGLLACAWLVRPNLQYFPPLLALFWPKVFPGRAGAWKAGALLLGFFLVAAPWFARNLITLKQLSDNTLQVSFLHHGMYPDFMYDQRKETYGFPYRFDPDTPRISRSTASVLTAIAERFRTEPVAHAVWFLIDKPIAFWSWNMVQGQGDVFIYPVSRTPYAEDPVFIWTHRLMRTLHPYLVWLGLAGCLVAWLPSSRRRLEPDALATVRFTALLLAYYTALHVVGAPFPRYSVPLRPFLYAMAVFAGCAAGDVALRGLRSLPPRAAAEGER